MIMNIKKPKIPKNISNNLYEDGSELRRGPWTLEEDNLLIQYITYHGEGQWNSLAKCAGLYRTGKSCRLRWLNYLKPDIKRGNLTPHEQLLILELHSRWGNRWSKIAEHLPGRTDNEIKNYWRTRVQKQARQLKVDSNSKKFLEAVRLHWMPRLLEKMEQNSSLTSSSPSSSITTVETQNLTPPSPLFTDLPSSCPKPVTNSDRSWKVPETSGVFTPPGAETCGNFFCRKLPDESHHVDIPGYDVEARGVSLSECHVADADWFGKEFGGIFLGQC